MTHYAAVCLFLVFGARMLNESREASNAASDELEEVEATLRAARDLTEPGGRLVVLFQPHLYSRTAHMAYEFGAALALADKVCVTAIYPAREQPRPGVTARLVLDALTDRRPGMHVGLAASLQSAALLVGHWLLPGDMMLTVGAGDVDRGIHLIAEQLS